MNIIKFLIVIPTLNSYKILQPLIDSLIKQTYEDWRVLFVDGKSSHKHREFLIKITQKDSRFNWEIEKTEKYNGIYTAMNQGFSYAKNNEWIIFWGSDDYASNPYVLERVANEILYLGESNICLLINNSQYYNMKTLRKYRSTSFNNAKIVKYDSKSFRNSMFLGASPPHQSTIFSPNAYNLVNRYSDKLKIAADLDYFLRVSKISKKYFYTTNINLVYLGQGGVSSIQSLRKLREVIQIYCREFKLLFFIPFICRYLRRFYSLLK